MVSDGDTLPLVTAPELSNPGQALEVLGTRPHPEPPIAPWREPSPGPRRLVLAVGRL